MATPGTGTVIGVHAWDSGRWVAVASIAGSPDLAQLATFDDGSGPALFGVGVRFSNNGRSVLKIHGLHGGSELLPLLGGPATSIVRHDDGAGPALFIGQQASTLWNRRLELGSVLRWLSCPPCPADFDNGSARGVRDGGITIDDLLYYAALYISGNARADLDDGSGTGTPDGGVTIADLLYYLGKYERGC